MFYLGDVVVCFEVSLRGRQGIWFVFVYVLGWIF